MSYSYEEDPWLWELDWSTEDYKLKKEVMQRRARTTSRDIQEEDNSHSKDSLDDPKATEKLKISSGGIEVSSVSKETPQRSDRAMEEDGMTEEERQEKEAREERLRKVIETATRMPKVKQHMVGYPL